MMLSSTIQDGAELLTDEETTEKTLSIIELIGSGGTAGQVIIGYSVYTSCRCYLHLF